MDPVKEPTRRLENVVVSISRTGRMSINLSNCKFGTRLTIRKWLANNRRAEVINNNGSSRLVLTGFETGMNLTIIGVCLVVHNDGTIYLNVENSTEMANKLRLSVGRTQLHNANFTVRMTT